MAFPISENALSSTSLSKPKAWPSPLTPPSPGPVNPTVQVFHQSAFSFHSLLPPTWFWRGLCLYWTTGSLPALIFVPSSPFSTLGAEGCFKMLVPEDDACTELPVVLRLKSQILNTACKQPVLCVARRPGFLPCCSSLGTMLSRAFAHAAAPTTTLSSFPQLILTLPSTLNIKTASWQVTPRVLVKCLQQT